MDYLINEKTGVIFEATPGLMHRKSLRTPTRAELLAAGYGPKVDPETNETVDDSDAVTSVPEDFDPFIDISTMNKVELLAVGAKVPGFKSAARTRVGELRSLLQEKLDDMQALLADEGDDIE